MKVCVWKLKHSMRGIPSLFTMIAENRNSGYTESLSQNVAVKPPRQSAAFFMPACRAACRFYQSKTGVETGHKTPERENPDAASTLPRVRLVARIKGGFFLKNVDMKKLAFRDVIFDVQTINNTIYITSVQLAAALGYADVDSVTRIYSRNRDEFTEEMSQTVKLTVSGNLARESRLFSLRGAHLVAMFSRTTVAKEFRRWVLDVLDSIARTGAYIHEPAMRPSITPEQVRELKTDVACFISGWLKLEEQWVYNHMRVAFQVAKVEHIPQEFFPLAKQLIASKREAHREFVHFICGLCRWFEREVLGAGTPWTPAIQKKLTKKLKRQVILPPRVDWLALADESKKEVKA